MDHVFDVLDAHYRKKEEDLGEENMRFAEKSFFLRLTDIYWMEHLENMDHLKNSVRLQAWGQKDPLVQYKNRGHEMFKGLLVAIKNAFAGSILKAGVSKQNLSQGGKPNLIKDDIANKDVGRNDECPCGSGKKFKRCHGA